MLKNGAPSSMIMQAGILSLASVVVDASANPHKMMNAQMKIVFMATPPRTVLLPPPV